MLRCHRRFPRVVRVTEVETDLKGTGQGLVPFCFMEGPFGFLYVLSKVWLDSRFLGNHAA